MAAGKSFRFLKCLQDELKKAPVMGNTICFDGYLPVNVVIRRVLDSICIFLGIGFGAVDFKPGSLELDGAVLGIDLQQVDTAGGNLGLFLDRLRFKDDVQIVDIMDSCTVWYGPAQTALSIFVDQCV